MTTVLLSCLILVGIGILYLLVIINQNLVSLYDKSAALYNKTVDIYNRELEIFEILEAREGDNDAARD